MSAIPREIRAVLFDVYGTLLHGRREPDRRPRMAEVAERHGFDPGPAIDDAFDAAIAAAHRLSPEPWPEIDVRQIWAGLFPGLADPAALAFDMEAAIHPVEVHPRGAAVLHEAIARELPLGIVSNAQAYTRTLLARHFPAAWPRFDPGLTVFSYEHGIAKPDCRLFRIAIDLLLETGIRPQEILMVGDSRENDLDPARALGLSTLAIPPP